MLIERRNFNGLNTDYSENVIPNGDYPYALNIHLGVSEKNTLGIATNVYGNELIEYADNSGNIIGLSGGTNTVIGTYEYKPNNTLYLFIHNSNGYHSIIETLEYVLGSNVSTRLLLDNPANPFLKFSLLHRITGINVYNGNLYWTERLNEPKKLIIDKAKGVNLYAGKPYPTPMLEEYITKMTPQPLFPPFHGYSYNEISYTENFIKGNVFQFRYSWLYIDNELSGLSPDSTLLYGSLQEDNTITFEFKTGNPLVQKIYVYGRTSNISDWFLIEILDKSQLSIPDNTDFIYTFRNDGNYSFINTAYGNQNFFRVPLNANTQEIVEGDRILYGDYTEDYDNTPVDGSFGITYNHFSDIGDAVATNNGSAVILYDLSVQREWYSRPIIGNGNIPTRGLKRGYKGQFGIVYFDKFGRSGAVNTNPNFKLNIPFWDNSFTNGNIWTLPTTANISMTITTRPPLWAVRYAIVREINNAVSDFFQFAPGKYNYIDDNGNSSNYTSGTKIVIDFSNSLTYYLNNGGIYGLIAEKGQRIRLIKPNWLPVSLIQDDFDILKADGGKVTIDNNLGFDVNSSIVNVTTGTPGPLVWEIYNPAKTNENQFYYEISSLGDVGNVGLTNTFHKGILPGDQSQTANLSQPAILNLPTFDTYLMLADWQSTNGKHYPILIETKYVSPYFDSASSDIGRPNIVSQDLKQTERKYNITFSELQILETNINGFNQFYDASFKSYTEVYGAIQKLYYDSNKLDIGFQQRIGFSLINQNTITDNANNQLSVNSSELLGSLNIYSGEFGIGDHPEAWTTYGHRKYFVDIYKGSALRLSNDGIIEISNYLAHAYWASKSTSILQSTSYLSTRIYGVYDKNRSEYVVSFVNDEDDTINETIAFNEDKNRWSSFYSFIPENVVKFQNTFASFKNGKLWLHWSANVPVNNFYGVQYQSELDVVFNAESGRSKALNSLFITCTTPWDVTVTNSRGQLSTLQTTDFQRIAADLNAAFKFDINTPNVTNPLFEGNVLKGIWSKMSMINTDTTPLKLFTVSVGYVDASFNQRPT